MRRSDRNLVRALLLFRNVTETHFNELMNASFLQRFPQHVVLVEEGNLPDFLHTLSWKGRSSCSAVPPSVKQHSILFVP